MSVPPPDEVDAPSVSVPTNTERLRSHLIPDGLAVALLDAWKKDDPEGQIKMLTALHNFHKPK